MINKTWSDGVNIWFPGPDLLLGIFTIMKFYRTALPEEGVYRYVLTNNIKIGLQFARYSNAWQQIVSADSLYTNLMK